MLKGDLVSTPLPTVLRDLSEGVASGCLHVDDGVGGLAKVYLRGGQVYAVQVPGRRPQLGARLVSSGSLGPEALAEALEAQRTELQGWRLGELLVHLGYVDQPVVEAFIHEQVREQTSDLLRWPTGTWKFRVNERTREDVAPPTPVEDLLSDVAERHRVWETITEVLHGPDAVPMLSAAGQSDAEMAIDPEAWSLLCKVDGVRSVAELARECGFTLFEAGQVVYSLVRSGLLEVEEVHLGSEEPTVVEEPMFEESITARLAAAFAPAIPAQSSEPTPEDMAALLSATLSTTREDRTMQALAPQDEDSIEGSLDRVSAALSALLGTTTDDSLFDSPKPRTKDVPKPMTAEEETKAAKRAEKAARDAKRRERDAEELAVAQADLEAARQASETVYDPTHEAEIVSLADVRREKDEGEAAAAAEAVRVAAEQAAAQAEADRLAAEQAEADRTATEHAELERERVAAETAEAERLAAETAEFERVAALQAEAAAQIEAERLAAEQVEAERLAAEAAEAAELERVAAAEAEAALAEAEAAEFERVASAQAEAERAAAADLAEAQAEADRVAGLEAAEAQRVAAEQAEAERVAEEERAEAERIATQDRLRVENELREAAQEQVAAEALAEVEREEREEQERRAAGDAAVEEQRRANEQRANAGSAFAELSAAAASSSDVAVAEAEDADQVEDPEDEVPAYRAPDTDMASLFRELSSLGMEDAPEPPPTRPTPAPRAAPPSTAAAKQKKKGLFGR